jgi:hypothetical protein
MAAKGHGDVFDGDGLVVVGQQIRRYPTQDAQRGVDRANTLGAVLSNSGDNSKPAPHQPEAEQDRRWTADTRAVTDTDCAHIPGSDPGWCTRRRPVRHAP